MNDRATGTRELARTIRLWIPFQRHFVFGKAQLFSRSPLKGDYGCGKTSIIHKLTTGTFSTEYKLSIGVDFTVKMMDIDGNKVRDRKRVALPCQTFNTNLSNSFPLAMFR